MEDCSAGKKGTRPKLEALSFWNMNSLQVDYMKREKKNNSCGHREEGKHGNPASQFSSLFLGNTT